DMAVLVTLMLAQSVWLELFLSLCFGALLFSGSDNWSVHYLGRWGGWILWGVPVSLALLSQLALLARGGRGRRWPLALSACMMAGVLALGVAARQPEFWFPEKEAGGQLLAVRADRTDAGDATQMAGRSEHRQPRDRGIGLLLGQLDPGAARRRGHGADGGRRRPYFLRLRL